MKDYFFELFVFIVKDTKNIKDNMFDKIRLKYHMYSSC